MNPEQIAAWKDEEQRQVQILTDALNRTLKEASASFDAPLMNAALGALAALQGAMLLAIPQGKPRKMASEMMERATRRFMRENADKDFGKTHLVDLGGKVG
jgi:hypothetical protein